MVFRFLVGGLVVSVFAVLGDCLKPKSFAGLFGAAPSVAYRDGVYGSAVEQKIRALRIHEVLTAPQSPWQNAYAERLIGSIRRECLNHVVILNARHLKRTLTKYFDYYHECRTHLGLHKQCPIERAVEQVGRIVAIPKVGGLHHLYRRAA